ncbi:MAG TPA: hypothetical protein VFW07_18780 [Parafilimonas sp.]|nr:hypothetical protein [Parafilimonas sp.]
MPKPSFALNYWRPWKENSNFIDSWLNYNKDVSLVEYQAEVINKNLNTLSADQIHTINALSVSVNDGVSLLMAGLGVINKSITITNQKLESLIQIEVANSIVIENIEELIKVPDREKERVYYIQSGLRFLKHAYSKNEFYDDAYTEFKKAEKLKPQDYYTLYNIGMIELYSAKHTNINSAKKCFDKAIKYASIDENSREYKYLSNLFSKQYGLKTDLNGKLFISICFIQSSICSYILGNDVEAFNTLVDVMPCDCNDEVYYFASKYAARAKENDTAYPLLDYYLRRNLDKLNKVVNDLDFIINPDINKYITHFIYKIENEFEDFKEKYKGQDEYFVYRFINDCIKQLGSKIEGKYNILNYFSDNYITSAISKEKNNINIDSSIEKKRIEIEQKRKDYDSLKLDFILTEKQMLNYKKLSEKFPQEGLLKRIVFIVVMLFYLTISVIMDFDINRLLNIFFISAILAAALLGLGIKGYKNVHISKYKRKFQIVKERLDKISEEKHRIMEEIKTLNSEATTIALKKHTVIYKVSDLA